MKTKKAEIKPLTSIRIFGAVWVLLLHMSALTLETYPFLDFLSPIFMTGFYGVNFFFILSGFVIWYVYGEEMSSKFSLRENIKFIINRIARLWPVNFLASFFVLGILAYSYAHSEFLQVTVADWYSPWSFLANILLIDQWRRPVIEYVWNQPAWAVSVEFFGYFLFPFIAILLGRYLKRLGFIPLLILAAIILFFHNYVPIFHNEWAYCWVIRWFYWFIAGVLLSMAYLKAGTRKLHWMSVLHYLLPVLLVLFTLTGWNTMGIEYMMPCIGFWIFSLAVSESYLSRVLSSKFMMTMGNISYSLFMLHWGCLICFAIATYTLHVDHEYYKYLVPVLVLDIFVASWLCWKYIEEPGRIIIRNFYTKLEKFFDRVPGLK
ncbi:acyltransferase [Candidatus Dojkabacteria bacterium]|nr:acyltransferase [Candidatus Dojkabacteria bacterium]